jgi:hypothetical protein
MKIAGLTLLLSVSLAVPLAGQVEVVPVASQIEHAATPEQCKADADAWGIPSASVLFRNEADFNRLSTLTAFNKSVDASTLEARMKQFSQCMRTDQNASVRYSEANRAYAIAQLLRMANFMKRHNLTSQFMQEDQEGQR